MAWPDVRAIESSKVMRTFIGDELLCHNTNERRGNHGVNTMIQVHLNDAKTQLPDLIAAAVRGETVLIETEGEQGTQTVQLVVVPRPQRRQRVPGSAKGLIVMSDDFDAPLEDFREYMG